MIPAISASVYAACASASGREQREGKKKRVGGFPIPPSKSGARRLVRSSSQLSSGAACTRNNTIILRESAVYPRPPQPAAVPSKEDAVQLRRPPAAAHHIHRPSPVAQKKHFFFPPTPPSRHITRRVVAPLHCAPHRGPRHATRLAPRPGHRRPHHRARALALAFTTLRTGEVGITKAAAGGVGPTTRNCDGFAAFFFWFACLHVSFCARRRRRGGRNYGKQSAGCATRRHSRCWLAIPSLHRENRRATPPFASPPT